MGDSPIVLPKAFIDNVNEGFSSSVARSLIEAIQEQKPPVSIRINPQKVKAKLSGLTQVPWCAGGYYLPERPVFTMDPYIHAGAYYVQEASSMMLGEVIRQLPVGNAPRVLDLCAAPGGKSTQLLSVLPAGAWVVSNEVIRNRANILYENLAKWGAVNSICTSSDPQAFGQMAGMFDLMVIDAPCSGEGLFRKDPHAIGEWDRDHVSMCGARQKRIVADAWASLAEGGYLVYSTCTFNEVENEGVLRWLIAEYDTQPVSLHLDIEGLLTYHVGAYDGYKALPGNVRGEGFCFFVLQKASGAERWFVNGKSGKKKKRSTWKAHKGSVEGMLSGETLLMDTGGDLWSASRVDELGHLEKYVSVMAPGIRVGTYKKEKLVPDHAWALSQLADVSAYPDVPLDHHEALTYLMKEHFKLDRTKGYYQMAFHGQRLGWINHLGNRFNNMYPAPWRVLKDFRKDELFTLHSFQ